MRHTTTHRLAPPAVGVLIALLLMAALIPLRLGTANAQETVELEGGDNISAAISISEYTFPDGAESAFLGRADLFADSLSSGGGQGLEDAPLLLTESDSLNADTAAELENLGAQTVYIMGGEEAISADVEQELQDANYETERFEGETRTETAIDLAQSRFPLATEAILARSHEDPDAGDETQAFADSLAAGGWAADDGLPVLLTLTDELTETTAEYFENSTVLRVYVVGGEDAISEDVVAALEAQNKIVVRVSGDTRFETAIAIANERGFETAADAESVIVAEGQDENAWAAGFAAASLADQANAPIVLVNGPDVPEPTREFFEGADGGAGAVFAQGSPTGSGSPSASPSASATEEPCEPTIPILPDILGECEATEEPSGSPGATASPTGGGGDDDGFADVIYLPGVDDAAQEEINAITGGQDGDTEEPTGGSTGGTGGNPGLPQSEITPGPIAPR